MIKEKKKGVGTIAKEIRYAKALVYAVDVSKKHTVTKTAARTSRKFGFGLNTFYKIWKNRENREIELK
jgi:hypothetical protein